MNTIEIIQIRYQKAVLHSNHGQTRALNAVHPKSNSKSRNRALISTLPLSNSQLNHWISNWPNTTLKSKPCPTLTHQAHTSASRTCKTNSLTSINKLPKP